MPIRFNKKASVGHRDFLYFRKLRFFSFLITLIFISGVVVTILFVYHTIYTTIDQAQALILLENQGGVEAIHFSKLERIEEAWAKKHDDTHEIFIRDPFHTAPVTTSTISATLEPETASTTLPTEEDATPPEPPPTDGSAVNSSL